MPLKKYTLLFLFLLLAAGVSAQYNTNQNKVWAFGFGGGVNFTSGIPTAFHSSLNFNEGIASVADAEGNLLFYTDAISVWDRTGTLMPHGDTIVPFLLHSSTQGALIVPVVGNPNQYYVFSNDDFSLGNIAYSIVDMSLNAGFGDVITPSGISMGNSFAEKMIAIPGDNCNIWLVTRRSYLYQFWVYNIDAAGIHPPAVYTVGHFDVSTGGVIKVSPNRHKIVEQNCMSSSWSQGTDLFDFDPATGVVSNGLRIDSFGYNYGAEFSPDNTKLYSARLGGYVLYQYDISLPSTSAIIASKTLIGPPTSYGDFKLGPDGKIYFVNGSALGYIPNPNAAGVACGHVTGAVPLVAGTLTGLGLPNTFYAVTLPDSAFTHHDTSVCMPVGGTVAIRAHGPPTGSGYVWNDGATTSTRNVSAAGTYWVYVANACTVTVDTIHVTVYRQVGAITGATHICSGQSSTLSDTSLSGVWSSSNPAVAPVTMSGSVTGASGGIAIITYHVVSTGCFATDTFVVGSLPRSDTVTGGGVRCFTGPGLAVNLSGSLSTLQYQLYNGAVAVGIPVTGAGSALGFGLQTAAGAYHIVATNMASGCTQTMKDTVLIEVIDSAATRRIDTTVCATGEVVTVTLKAPTATSYHWYDGATASTHIINAPGAYWVAYITPCGNKTDTFHVVFTHPPCITTAPTVVSTETAIFPNPAFSSLDIVASPDHYNYFFVRNSIGQVLIQQPLTSQQTTVDIALLPAGVYYLTLQGDGENKVLKFVKM